MILCDRDIQDLIEAGRLGIDPEPDMGVQLQPASLDLRLGDEFLKYTPVDQNCNPIHHAMLLGKHPERVTSKVKVEGSFVISPGDFVLGHTLESIRIPDDMVAQVEGRSSLARLGIAVHITAGFIDPGFEGQITLEIKNNNSIPIVLETGSRVCQLILHRMTNPSEVPYNRKPGSHYNGSVGVVPSRFEFSQ